jgi:hypothetical protein
VHSPRTAPASLIATERDVAVSMPRINIATARERRHGARPPETDCVNCTAQCRRRHRR